MTTFTPAEIDALLRKAEEHEECEHLDVCQDELVCLDCGEDLREQYMARVYDRYKDHYKYGET